MLGRQVCNLIEMPFRIVLINLIIIKFIADFALYNKLNSELLIDINGYFTGELLFHNNHLNTFQYTV